MHIFPHVPPLPNLSGFGVTNIFRHLALTRELVGMSTISRLFSPLGCIGLSWMWLDTASRLGRHRREVYV